MNWIIIAIVVAVGLGIYAVYKIYNLNKSAPEEETVPSQETIDAEFNEDEKK